MKIIVTGASGLIGAEILRQAILDNDIEEIIALSRNPPPVNHSKIRFVQHNDFMDYSSLDAEIKNADAIIWALGISQTQVSKADYLKITYDFVIACAAQCRISNPSIRFVFVSGDGADTTEKSGTLFKKIKGRAENGLKAMGLELYIARPDAVNPRHKNPKAPFAYKLAYPFFPLVEWLAPHKIIWSDVLARALIRIAKANIDHRLFENKELRSIGA